MKIGGKKGNKIMNACMKSYLDYLNENNLDYEITNDGTVVMEKPESTFFVGFEKGIDIKILYKVNMTEDLMEKYKGGDLHMIYYFSSEKGIWFARKIIEFDKFTLDDTVKIIERNINMIEKTALLFMK